MVFPIAHGLVTTKSVRRHAHEVQDYSHVDPLVGR
jgi:hypothetical protein